MKKIVSVLLLVFLLALTLVGCGGKTNEREYALTIAVDSAFSGVKTSNTACALILDADGRIVSCRLDCAESSLTLADGELATDADVKTKVELGDDYYQMPHGTWKEQAAAFERFVIGKNAQEVAAIDFTVDEVVAGCTMKSSMATFKTVIAKAFAYERKVTFKTSKEITFGLGIRQSLSGSVADENAKVSADFAAIAMVEDKVVAAILDSCERSFTIAVNADDNVIEATPAEYNGTKNEQGDAYDAYKPMPAGRWYAQAQAYANSAIGKTAAELSSLDTVSDALAAAGCTLQSTTGGYKTAIIKAASNIK